MFTNRSSYNKMLLTPWQMYQFVQVVFKMVRPSVNPYGLRLYSEFVYISNFKPINDYASFFSSDNA